MVAIRFSPSKKFISPFFKFMGFELNFFLKKILYSFILCKSKLISAFLQLYFGKIKFFLFDKL